MGLLLTFSYSAFSNDNDAWKKKVSPQIIEQFDWKEFFPIIVYFSDQERFQQGIEGTKLEKGNMVYERLNKNAANNQQLVREYLDRENIQYVSFYIVNAIRLIADQQTISNLAEFDEVKYISFDAPVKLEEVRADLAEYKTRAGTPEWGIQIIQADKVWEMGFNGQNVVVGGQDTGYDWTHPALKSKYRGYINENEADHNYNWHDSVHEISPLSNDSIVDPSNNPCGLNVPYPCDDQNHGTHTMGTMVGRDGDNIIGVAPGAKWIGVRNMERGWGSPSTYLESFEWFLAPTDLNGENADPDKSPHVINNSWSCPLIEGCDSTNWEFLDLAINNLRTAGVMVVVSASNNGNNCGSINSPPGMLEGSFAVAATRIVDTIDGVFIDDIAGYSSWGPVMVDNSFRLKPDIAAPGSGVRSCIPGNKYSVSSGTSMAGPHVAGVVALIISAAPDLAGQVEIIEDIIELSAEPKIREASCSEFSGEDVPNFIFGSGRINAYNAVTTALLYQGTIDQSMAEPDVKLFPNPANKYFTVSWASDQTSANIKMVDLSGRTFILASVENGDRLDISFLPDGIYLLKTIIDSKLITRKIIKQTSL